MTSHDNQSCLYFAKEELEEERELENGGQQKRKAVLGLDIEALNTNFSVKELKDAICNPKCNKSPDDDKFHVIFLNICTIMS